MGGLLDAGYRVLVTGCEILDAGDLFKGQKTRTSYTKHRISRRSWPEAKSLMPNASCLSYEPLAINTKAFSKSSGVSMAIFLYVVSAI